VLSPVAAGCALGWLLDVLTVGSFVWFPVSFDVPEEELVVAQTHAPVRQGGIGLPTMFADARRRWLPEDEEVHSELEPES
jgi:hypothetical protein